MKKVCLLLVCFSLIVVTYSVNVLAKGTLANTPIPSSSTIGAANAAQISTTSQSVNVYPVWGLATSTVPVVTDGSVNAGATTTYNGLTVVNNSNSSTNNIYLEIGSFAFDETMGSCGNTASWSVAVDVNSDTYVSADYTINNPPGSGTAPIGLSIQPDNKATFSLMITSATDSASGCIFYFPVAFKSDLTMLGFYNGFNGTVGYGGVASIPRIHGTIKASNELSTTVSGPILYLTYSAPVVEAPPSYVSNGGGPSDPVPGASITYNIKFGNKGSGAATTVTIDIPIPENTQYIVGTSKMYNCFSNGCSSYTLDPDSDDANPDCYIVGAPVTSLHCDIDMLSGNMVEGVDDWQMKFNVIIE